MITIPREEIGPKGHIQNLPVREELVQDLINFLFRTKRWQQDPDYLLREFRRRRNKMFEEGKAALRKQALGVNDPAEPDWKERVRTNRRKNAAHWTLNRLASLVSQTPEAVQAALNER